MALAYHKIVTLRVFFGQIMRQITGRHKFTNRIGYPHEEKTDIILWLCTEKGTT